ncbi:MAG TPA: substrate binding domain-containing protein, partial [Anaeromyxobacter sp.]|nr:substrate binding domain-containing protein [Anaeromyxobacter sp.]
GFDLAIRAGHLADSSLVSRRLGRPQQVRLYASPTYLRARGTPRRIEDLAHHDCLVLSGAPRSWPLRRNRRIAEVPVHVRASASGFELLRALALAGHGIARLPEYLAAEDVRRGALRTMLDALAPPPQPLHVVYPSARHVTVKLRKLLELLDTRFP